MFDKVKVIRKHKPPRSYVIKNKYGNCLLPNHSQFLLIWEPSLNGKLDNIISDCDHNESYRNVTLLQYLGTNS